MDTNQAYRLMGEAYERFALSPEFCEAFRCEHGTSPRNFIASTDAQNFIDALPADDPLRRQKEAVDFEIKMRMVAQWRAAQES